MIAPPGFALVEVAFGPDEDRHAAGRRAATEALAQLDPRLSLGYDGPRPVARGPAPGAAVSITHGRTRAFAIAGRVARLGIDLVDDLEDERLAQLAARYLADELPLIETARDRAACFAAKEAGLKALGKGLLDGGMFDSCLVRVCSLTPPRLEPEGLTLLVGRSGAGTLAVVHDAR